MRQRATQFVLAVALVILPAGNQLAHAAVVINIDQVGPDVVSTASGTIDLTGLAFLFTTEIPDAQLIPASATVVDQPIAVTDTDLYEGATGPGSFGAGSAVNATTGAGDIIGVEGADGFIYVPAGYISGTVLSATDTYASQTFSSLGLTPGTYTYTWSAVPDGSDDSLTVQIGPAVPLPAAAWAAIPLLGLCWLNRRAVRA